MKCESPDSQMKLKMIKKFYDNNYDQKSLEHYLKLILFKR